MINYKYVKTDLIPSPMCSVTVSFSTHFDNDYLLNQLFHFDQNVILLLTFAVVLYFSIYSIFFSKSVSI